MGRGKEVRGFRLQPSTASVSEKLIQDSLLTSTAAILHVPAKEEYPKSSNTSVRHVFLSAQYSEGGKTR